MSLTEHRSPVVPGRSGCRVTAEVVSGLAVVAVGGALGVDALPACRKALDDVLRRRPVTVVLDLKRVTDGSAAVAVLDLLRRYVARHGSRLWLAAPSSVVTRTLEEAHVCDQYEVVPSVASAFELASRRARPTATDRRLSGS